MNFLHVGRLRSLACTGLLAALLAGCGAGAAPPELHNARDAYKKAQDSKAPKLAPAHLDTARQSLEKAEAAFKEGGDDQVVKDLAYIAQRKSAIAVAAAEVEDANRELEKVEKDKEIMLENLQAHTEASLRKTKEQLEAEKRQAERDRMKSSAQLEKERAEKKRTKAELASERKRRIEAEKKAAAALASLQEIARVKEEARGTVITLSGAVLFATGKYELLPIAQQKLDEVASALKDQGEDAQIIVEGHTDSRGSSSKNRELSMLRAQNVRSHLISRGLKSANIKAVGMGEDRPIASNDTAEGRANNRRVEIIVKPEK